MIGGVGRSRGPASRGNATLEYIGLVILIAGILTALLAGPAWGIGQKIATKLCTAISTIVGGEACGDTDSRKDQSEHTSTRVARIREHQQQRAGFVNEHGGVYAAKEARINELIEQGRIDAAERLDRRLAYYIQLARQGERGALLDRLWSATGSEFRRMMQRGSISIPDPTHPDSVAHNDSIRYFQIPPKPGGGVIVVDFFIPEAASGFVLSGDDRGHRNPISLGLSRNRSRMMIVIDQETGRGLIYVSNSCTTNLGPLNGCNNARPIAFPDDGAWMEDPTYPDDTDYDQANQFRVYIGEQGDIIVHYDALNSITPFVFSVDGTMAIDRDLDFPQVRRNMDDYPSVGWWHYDPKTGEAHRFAHQNAESVWTGAPGGQREGVPEVMLPGPLPLGGESSWESRR